MLPLRDDIPSRTFPGVTIAIIIANVLGFLNELRMGEGLDLAMEWYLQEARGSGPSSRPAANS